MSNSRHRQQAVIKNQRETDFHERSWFRTPDSFLATEYTSYRLSHNANALVYFSLLFSTDN
jgi:hypothetical protein